MPFSLAGCSDQVVGYFDGSGTSSVLDPSTSLLTGVASDTAAASDGSGEPMVGSEGGSGTGTGGFMPPGCIGDDFEDGVIDPDLWNTWAEENSNLEEVAGWMKFTPPTYGLFDTGVVTTYLNMMPFDNAWARMQVVAPPDPARPVVLFLQVVEEPLVLSINVAESTVSINASEDFVPFYSESFPADPYPGWIGIRAEGDMVHFETSDDGVMWTTLTTHPKPGAFAAARPLIMAQTYGEDVLGGIVAVDNFEACAQ